MIRDLPHPPPSRTAVALSPNDEPVPLPRFVAGKLPGVDLALFPRESRAGALMVAVALDGKFAGLLFLADELRLGTETLLNDLRSMGIRRIVLATGELVGD